MNPALDEAVLAAHGITHVVNATNRCVPNQFTHLTYCNVDLDDDEASELTPHFKRVFDFIKGAQGADGREGAVLVHCMCGVSRSATLVIAYLMRENSWSARRAFEWTKAQRPVVAPNPAFAAELLALEKVLGTSDRDGGSIAPEEMVGKNYKRANANAANARRALDAMGGAEGGNELSAAARWGVWIALAVSLVAVTFAGSGWVAMVWPR
jgi:hypothetical protein